MRPTEIVIHHYTRGMEEFDKHEAGRAMVKAWGCKILDQTTSHDGELTLKLKWPGPYTNNDMGMTGGPDFEVTRWEMCL